MRLPERSFLNNRLELSDDLLRLPPLPRDFYLRDTPSVARELLGKGLVIHASEPLVVQIVEVEAYLGFKDEASHAFRGLTKRNWPMFESGGTCYVYLSYGVHYCMNVVTEKKGVGEAVLLRGGLAILGQEKMLKNRGIAPGRSAHLLDGPGKLTRALGVNLRHNGLHFDQDDFKLVDLGIKISADQVVRSQRVGISKAQALELRFFVTPRAR
ncbi:MAG: DNA-3-methyladenine glycosylase [Deltaproteobacteria bacterium]|nr:DNA-3-methyladenine glycosylase [Deltaproteobacteria bacterium]